MEQTQQINHTIRLLAPQAQVENILWTLGLPYSIIDSQQLSQLQISTGLWITQDAAEVKLIQEHDPQAPILNLYRNSSPQTRMRHWGPSQEGIPYSTGVDGIDWKGPRYRYPGAHIWSALDQSLVYQERLLHWGLDLSVLWANLGTQAKSFSHLVTDRLPHEDVSTLSKGAVLILFRESLRYLLAKIQVPLRAYPTHPLGYGGVFLYKIDTDGADLHQLQDYAQALSDRQLRANFFLDMAPLQGAQLPASQQLQDHEWNLHCDQHFTSENRARNRANLDSGLQGARHLLAHIPGKHLQGHGAPYGIHPPHLAELQEELGFGFGSEFGWSYNVWPLQMQADAKRTHQWQVAFHPICPQSLMSSRLQVEDWIRYYQHLGSRQMSLNLPIAWYDHPHHPDSHARNRFLDFISQWVAGDNPRGLPLKQMTCSEYLQWWRQDRMQEELQEVPIPDHTTHEHQFLKARRFNFRRWKQNQLRRHLYRNQQ